MELWVTEYQTPALGFTCKTTQTLKVEQTRFQHLAVVETEQFGRMLLLDGMVQTTEKDEFVYHEMITMVALNSHPHPQEVLIIGGGDGGTLRETVNHPQVERGTLVEIDERVILASQEFFPQLSSSFTHPKARVIIDDGIKFIQEKSNCFDVIIIDSTEPVGPAVQLFSKEFYGSCYKALKEDGMLVVQSESPYFNHNVIRMAYNGIGTHFPLTKLYLASIPTYPSGLWSFTIGSKKYNPQKTCNHNQLDCRYYTSEVHKGSFYLPKFIQEIIA